MSDKLSAEQVTGEITDAFPDRPLRPGNAFAEWGRSYPNSEKFQAQAAGRTWRTLSIKFLKFFHDALPQLGAAAFAEYLPAYLSAVINQHEAATAGHLTTSLVSSLSRDKGKDTARFDARVGKLTANQQTTVARALAYLESAEEDPAERQALTEALDGYWRELLDEGQGR